MGQTSNWPRRITGRGGYAEMGNFFVGVPNSQDMLLSSAECMETRSENPINSQ